MSGLFLEASVVGHIDRDSGVPIQLLSLPFGIHDSP
jgi:hypothetical protein